MKLLKAMPKIYVHPILLIFILIAFLTGTFTELVIILSIVLIHELGHYTVARLFKWRIHHIMLWVFGGVMHTEEHGSQNLFEEALVTIAGPFQHIVIYGVTYILDQAQLLPPSVMTLIYFYNTVILLFNLLPIWPLDGGKLLRICLSSLFPYRMAYHMVILSSIIACLALLALQVFLLPFTLSAFLMICFLLFENIHDWRHRFYVFIRFLLNRYETNNHITNENTLVISPEDKLIDVFSLFMQTKKHIIYVGLANGQQEQLSEYECLHYYFYHQNAQQSIGDLLYLQS